MNSRQLRISSLIIVFLFLLTVSNTEIQDKAIIKDFNNDKVMIIRDNPIIADHSIANLVRLDLIPETAINYSKEVLHIAYGHTSHGSQVTSGMSGLDAFKDDTGLYDWAESPGDGVLDLDDYFMDGDLGNPDRITWCNRTREYLDNGANTDVNVIIWSWCGQVDGSEEDINLYLSLMSGLEIEYPDVTFVYMTGHAYGQGLEGNIHIRNAQIRDYCTTNNKVLFDFYDIECYDPDGNYYGDKYVWDSCNWDDQEGSSGNWATEWQTAHPGEWYACDPSHTVDLNGNMKAYAAWWLWARLSGWEDNITVTTTSSSSSSSTSTSTSSLVIPTTSSASSSESTNIVSTTTTTTEESTSTEIEIVTDTSSNEIDSTTSSSQDIVQSTPLIIDIWMLFSLIMFGYYFKKK